jgi:hypothetical protein
MLLKTTTANTLSYILGYSVSQISAGSLAKKSAPSVIIVTGRETQAFKGSHFFTGTLG